MQKDHIANISRRRFLIGTAAAGAGLTLGLYLPACSRKQPSPGEKAAAAAHATAQPTTELDFNAFVRVSPDNKVRVKVDLDHVWVGNGHTLKLLLDHIFYFVNKFFHESLLS